MKYQIILFCLCFVALFSACHNEDIPEVKNERTVLVYIAGNNSLSQFISSDLAEMKEGMKELNPDQNTLLVFVSDYNSNRLLRITKDSNGEVLEEMVQEYDKTNTLDVNFMKGVFATAFGRYPADSYGLVLWSHGDGWIPTNTLRWWGQDGSNFMNISDLNEALKSAPHFEFILFDACFMSSAEVAYQLRERTDCLIGCPTETPGPGAPYQTVVPAMFSTQQTASGIATAYFKYYEDKYDDGNNLSNYNWTAGSCVSVLQTDKIEQLAAATAKVLPKYVQNGAAIDVTGIMRYDLRSSRYYYDLDRLIYKLTGGNTDYTEWRTAFDAAIIYWKSTPKNYSGLAMRMFAIDPEVGGFSVYIPSASNASINTFYKSLEWYQSAGWSQTGW